MPPPGCSCPPQPREHAVLVLRPAPGWGVESPGVVGREERRAGRENCPVPPAGAGGAEILLEIRVGEAGARPVGSFTHPRLFYQVLPGGAGTGHKPARFCTLVLLSKELCRNSCMLDLGFLT